MYSTPQGARGCTPRAQSKSRWTSLRIVNASGSTRVHPPDPGGLDLLYNKPQEPPRTGGRTRHARSAETRAKGRVEAKRRKGGRKKKALEPKWSTTEPVRERAPEEERGGESEIGKARRRLFQRAATGRRKQAAEPNGARTEGADRERTSGAQSQANGTPTGQDQVQRSARRAAAGSSRRVGTRSRYAVGFYLPQ